MSPLRIAIAGLGTVGSATLTLLQKQADEIAAKAGRPVKIVAVSARSKSKHNQLDLTGIDWVDHAEDLALRSDVDVVCELIGGAEGPAKALSEKAILAGKSVITANKALLATHGAELAALAESKGVSIHYEAAVAGAIPVIKTLKESVASDQLRSVHGIVNGTSNYILSLMSEKGMSFNAALDDASERGYAEANPSADIDGYDAAHKAVIMGAIAFGIKPDMNAIRIQGIRDVTAADIQLASKLGYVIKHVVKVSQTSLSASPSLLPKDTPLAAIDGVLNAVVIDAVSAGSILLTGAGAGGEATASAVLSDIFDAAKGSAGPVFGRPAADLKPLSVEKDALLTSKRYIRLEKSDKAGNFEHFQAVLQPLGIGIESLQEQDGLTALITNEIDDALAQKMVEETDATLCLSVGDSDNQLT